METKEMMSQITNKKQRNNTRWRVWINYVAYSHTVANH